MHLNRFVFLFLGIFLISLVIAQPPSFHQFYGSIFDSEGNLVTDNLEIMAYINGNVAGAGISSNGLYGYENLFFVEWETGDEISFYVGGYFSKTYVFESEATSEFNLSYAPQEKQEISQQHGNSGGGGGGGVTGKVVSECAENWKCGEWSECLSGYIARECEDLNNCGSLDKKPKTVQECGIVDGKSEVGGGEIKVTSLTGLAVIDADTGQKILLPVLLFVILAVCIVFLIRSIIKSVV